MSSINYVVGDKSEAGIEKYESCLKSMLEHKIDRYTNAEYCQHLCGT